jgi:hypothetical protein
MMAMEFMACCVAEDPTFPALVDGYVVTFMAFYQ